MKITNNHKIVGVTLELETGNGLGEARLIIERDGGPVDKPDSRSYSDCRKSFDTVSVSGIRAFQRAANRWTMRVLQSRMNYQIVIDVADTPEKNVERLIEAIKTSVWFRDVNSSLRVIKTPAYFPG